MEDVLARLAHNRESDFEELLEFLSVPSVSADPAYAGDVSRCAEWLAGRFRGVGLETTVEATGGHPAVLARWHGAEGAPTYLVYGHYDVQPAEAADGWTTDPFDPLVKDGKLFARGATDDKGQLYCHVAAVRAHLEARGRLPVNLVFLVEGEEESGSDHLEAYVEANRERLGCDAVIISDSGQFAEGVPAITYGLRGLVYVEATLTGPSRDLHSGSFGGAVINPANALARMVAALHDDRGRIAVPGFHEQVRPIEPWEREQFAALPFDEDAYRTDLGVPALGGEAGCTTLERVWARPTLDVNGFVSGYTGQGAKTIIPASATVKLSCRLVPDQDPDRVAGALERRLNSLCPAACTLEIKRLHGARPILVPVDDPAVAAARRAVAKGFGAEPVLIREGGSIPVVETFHRVLGASVVLMGFGRPDDRAHGPDERIHLADLEAGAKASAWLWEMLGGVNGEEGTGNGEREGAGDQHGVLPFHR